MGTSASLHIINDQKDDFIPLHTRWDGFPEEIKEMFKDPNKNLIEFADFVKQFMTMLPKELQEKLPTLQLWCERVENYAKGPSMEIGHLGALISAHGTSHFHPLYQPVGADPIKTPSDINDYWGIEGADISMMVQDNELSKTRLRRAYSKVKAKELNEGYQLVGWVEYNLAASGPKQMSTKLFSDKKWQELMKKEDTCLQYAQINTQEYSIEQMMMTYTRFKLEFKILEDWINTLYTSAYKVEGNDPLLLKINENRKNEGKSLLTASQFQEGVKGFVNQINYRNNPLASRQISYGFERIERKEIQEAVAGENLEKIGKIINEKKGWSQSMLSDNGNCGFFIAQLALMFPGLVRFVSAGQMRQLYEKNQVPDLIIESMAERSIELVVHHHPNAAYIPEAMEVYHPLMGAKSLLIDQLLPTISSDPNKSVLCATPQSTWMDVSSIHVVSEILTKANNQVDWSQCQYFNEWIDKASQEVKKTVKKKM